MLDGPVKGKPQRGIYQLDKDRLVLCINNEKDQPPTEFATKAGDGLRLLTLQREKPKEADTVYLPDAVLDEVDARRKTITVTLGMPEEGVPKREAEKVQTRTKLVHLPIAPNAEIRISSRKFPSVGNNEARAANELTPGKEVSLKLAVVGSQMIVTQIVEWR